MRKLLFIIVLGNLSLSLPLQAKNRMSDPVSGLIVDARTKEPLPFANIVVLGLQKGTVSNAEGRFAFDREKIPGEDTVQFSYMGYETLRIPVSSLNKKNRIRMNRASIDLEEVQVSARTISAREIVALAESNFSKNHPEVPQRQELFFHSFEKVPFSRENRFHIKKSDFPGLDEKSLEEIIELIPEEFTGYQDAVLNLYSMHGENKILPGPGISLEEGSMEALGREMETRLGEFFEDVEQTRKDEDVYYQFRSGIFRHKFKGDAMDDSLWNEYQNDTLNYTVEISETKNEIESLLSNYTTPSGKNWEFLTDRGKYEYIKEEVTIYEDEFVYRISFTPTKRGKYTGNLLISISDYGIMQVDFEFAEGKHDEKFNFAGFSHLMNFRKGRVIYEKRKSGYYLKYLNAEQQESASVDRKFAVLKKQKAGLRDKVLNEIEVDLELYFDISSTWELLVLDREVITEGQYHEITEPLFMKFRKKYAYTPEMWENRTVLVPVTELQNYTRR